MTNEEMDFIGSMNMCDEISNEAYKKIMTHCEEQEPCNDAISRQAAIDELYKMLHDCFWADDEELDAVITTLNELPSVIPQPRMGEWLKNGELCKCSNCHSLVLRSVVKSYNYCFRCGAKMEVSE